jgi:hypothetical protein
LNLFLSLPRRSIVRIFFFIMCKLIFQRQWKNRYGFTEWRAFKTLSIEFFFSYTEKSPFLKGGSVSNMFWCSPDVSCWLLIPKLRAAVFSF